MCFGMYIWTSQKRIENNIGLKGGKMIIEGLQLKSNSSLTTLCLNCDNKERNKKAGSEDPSDSSEKYENEYITKLEMKEPEW